MKIQSRLKSISALGTLLFLFLIPLGAVEYPPILPVEKQAEFIDNWLKIRLDTIIPELMRREKIDLWLVICREYNEDPVFLTLVPSRWYAARRTTMLVFFDRGKEGVERSIVQPYRYGDLYTPAWTPGQTDQWQCLADLITSRSPQKIGINVSPTHAFGDGLTASLRDKLLEYLGKTYSSRLCSAENLAVGWLEKRISQELDTYPQIIAVAHAIIAEAFSNQVIIPGITTTQEVEWWMLKKIRQLGLESWFQPSVDLQRLETGKPEKPGKLFKTITGIIQRGDLLHCDMGLTYLRLNSDTQELAYVLKEGETAAPAGLVEALRLGNRLQDIFTGQFQPGLTGNQLLLASLAKAQEQGIAAQIYTHPLGFHGHGAGPVIGLWDKQDGVPGSGDYPLFTDTCYAIELNARVPVPEWNGQVVWIALEQDAAFTSAGVYYLDGRQTQLHIIK